MVVTYNKNKEIFGSLFSLKFYLLIATRFAIISPLVKEISFDNTR
ncbi:hypothetical protein [Salmonella phage vB_SenS_SB10]|uniref:Uncharacterized protein n=1 Tax=Salmonella phage vB_SenS_SB10 TaxID=2591134 RepID=A0A5J6TCG9_9CAUD|nr:hypothetical protein [Salmonella phage vB_SenS_SB10]